MRKINVTELRKCLHNKYFLSEIEIKGLYDAGIFDAPVAILMFFIATLRGEGENYKREKKIAEKLGIRSATAINVLKQLKDNKIITREGKHGARRRNWAWGTAITAQCDTPKTDGSDVSKTDGSDVSKTDGSHNIINPYKSILKEKDNNNVNVNPSPLPEIKEKIKRIPSSDSGTESSKSVYKIIPKVEREQKLIKLEVLRNMPTHDSTSGILGGTNVYKLFIELIALQHDRAPIKCDEAKEGQILFNRLGMDCLNRRESLSHDLLVKLLERYVCQMKLDNAKELFGSVLGNFIVVQRRIMKGYPVGKPASKPIASLNQEIPVPDRPVKPEPPIMPKPVDLLNQPIPEEFAIDKDIDKMLAELMTRRSYLGSIGKLHDEDYGGDAQEDEDGDEDDEQDDEECDKEEDEIEAGFPELQSLRKHENEDEPI